MGSKMIEDLLKRINYLEHKVCEQEKEIMEIKCRIELRNDNCNSALELNSTFLKNLMQSDKKKT
jgi:hypothetical protein